MQNGKGSKRRSGENLSKINENWDYIKWPSQEKKKEKTNGKRKSK
jgi:hypothetical protein